MTVESKPVLYAWDTRYYLLSDDGMPFGMAQVVLAHSLRFVPEAIAAREVVDVSRIEVTYAARRIKGETG